MMRFQKAYDELVALDRDWDSIVAKGDPDNIRRRLGSYEYPPILKRLISSENAANLY